MGSSWTPIGVNSHATLWNGSELLDLNSFLDEATRSAGWFLMAAIDINDTGSGESTESGFMA